MTGIIRFKPVEIDSKVCFVGKKKKVLNYPVRSISLVPVPESHQEHLPRIVVPEIFWQ